MTISDIARSVLSCYIVELCASFVFELLEMCGYASRDVWLFFGDWLGCRGFHVVVAMCSEQLWTEL
jgi:hypothetical protein